MARHFLFGLFRQEVDIVLADHTVAKEEDYRVFRGCTVAANDVQAENYDDSEVWVHFNIHQTQLAAMKGDASPKARMFPEFHALQLMCVPERRDLNFKVPNTPGAPWLLCSPLSPMLSDCEGELEDVNRHEREQDQTSLSRSVVAYCIGQHQTRRQLLIPSPLQNTG